TSGAINLTQDFLLNNTPTSSFPNPIVLTPTQTLFTQIAVIGDTGTGTFTQNGGEFAYNTVSGLIIGGRTAANTSAVGTYNHNGGVISNFANSLLVVGSF